MFGRPLADLSAFEEHSRLSNVWYGTIRLAIMKISCVLLPMDGSIRYAFPPWDLIRRVLGTRTEGNRRQDVSDSTCLPNQPHLLNMLADLPFSTANKTLLCLRRWSIWYRDLPSRHLAVWRLSGDVDGQLESHQGSLQSSRTISSTTGHDSGRTGTSIGFSRC